MERYNDISGLQEVIKKRRIKKVLIVCGHSYDHLTISKEIAKLPIEIVYFRDFNPNPKYEDILKGINVFKENKCDSIMAIGGGSAIDVSKCIKLFSKLDDKKLYFNQQYKSNNMPFIAIPTTAGSGSEETPFAVIYYNGEKKSIHHQSILPSYVFLIPEVLLSLPLYQKKATLLDAFSQAIESYWSVNSNNESLEYAKRSINLIIDNYEDYLMNNPNSYSRIMQASNYAGRAIAITKTTAPHAMSYKLTGLYGIAHGQAVFLTLPYVLEYMLKNLDKTTDERGKSYFIKTLKKLSNILKCNSLEEMVSLLKNLYKEIGFDKIVINENDISELVKSVNTERLKNNPVLIDEKGLEQIYKKALK